MDKLETYLSTSHATEIIVQWHLENAAASRVQMLADRPLLGAVERNGVRPAVRWQQDLWRDWFSLYSLT